MLRMQQLLETGADVDVRTSGGVTLLMEAAGAGRTDIMELLISHSADVNATNKNGCSPLFYAATHYRGYALRVLLGAGASVAVRPHGLSLLEFAKVGGGLSHEVFEMLRKAGAT